MNWKNRFTNYNFWISIFSAVLLILQALKIEFDFLYVNEIFTAVLGLLVVIGIINDPTRTTVKTTEKTEKTTTEKSETPKETLPIKQENEVDNVNNENGVETVLDTSNIQAIVEKISYDLDKKFKELERVYKPNVAEHTQVVKAETVQENPYIDVIN